jgi:predicted MFS family arabinose efflux permease
VFSINDLSQCSFSIFLPSSLGVALLVTIISAFWSDRYESRGITTALISLLGVAGFALYLGAEHKFTSYGALYLMVPGAYASAPVLAAWMANNSEPHYRRATSVAIGFIATNSVCFFFLLLQYHCLYICFYIYQGGILSTWSFPTNEGPKYRKTTIMNLIL